MPSFIAEAFGVSDVTLIAIAIVAVLLIMGFIYFNVDAFIRGDKNVEAGISIKFGPKGEGYIVIPGTEHFLSYAYPEGRSLYPSYNPKFQLVGRENMDMPPGPRIMAGGRVAGAKKPNISVWDTDSGQRSGPATGAFASIMAFDESRFKGSNAFAPITRVKNIPELNPLYN